MGLVRVEILAFFKLNDYIYDCTLSKEFFLKLA